MPLSPAAPRAPMHRRTIVLDGYVREDGLVDVEAHLRDTKPFDVTLDHGALRPAGEPMHDMWLRLTVNRDRLIVAAEAAMDATPHLVCPQAAPNFARLTGLTLQGGFIKDALARVGGTSGCTHLREMLQQVATVAIQTLYSVRGEERRRAREAGEVEAPVTPKLPPLLNTCLAYDETGPLVRQLFPEQFAREAAE